EKPFEKTFDKLCFASASDFVYGFKTFKFSFIGICRSFCITQNKSCQMIRRSLDGSQSNITSHRHATKYNLLNGKFLKKSYQIGRKKVYTEKMMTSSAPSKTADIV